MTNKKWLEDTSKPNEKTMKEGEWVKAVEGNHQKGKVFVTQNDTLETKVLNAKNDKDCNYHISKKQIEGIIFQITKNFMPLKNKIAVNQHIPIFMLYSLANHLEYVHNI